jgi:CMP-N-acetylneuraminic acid synthetase
VAGCDSEFKEMATKYNVGFIQRTRTSSLAETPQEIHTHLKDFGLVCHVNVCCPMLESETIYRAIEELESTKATSLFSVKESHEIIFNNSRKLVNADNIFNSKMRKVNYVGNNAIAIFNMSSFYQTGLYWTYQSNDPRLFVMRDEESVDIDTELDFQIAQYLYSRK